MLNIGVVLSGGVGSRYGSKTPKQYLMLNGKEVISYAIKALKNSHCVDVIIVACDKQYQEHIKSSYGVEVCDGGNTRNKTVNNVLEYVNKNHSEATNIIFVDSARPLINHNSIKQYFEHLKDNDSVITGQKITDSLGSFSERRLNREDFYLVQTPEAFRFNVIKKYFDVDAIYTALYQHLPNECSLYVYFEQNKNIKITYPGDITYIENSFKDLLEK